MGNILKSLSIAVILSIGMVSLRGETLEDRIDNLIAQMTLQEKILQLHRSGMFTTADNANLGIPGFVMADGPHGVRDGQATCFPVGIAMAATWDPGLVQKIGQAMGEEFRAKGKNQALGPCIDLCRDPRNGRSPESGGEDPYLCAQITTALARGIQMTPCIATIKHFNCVNKQHHRHYRNVIITERLLMEHYGLNFRNAVQRGGALCVMNAYNKINYDKCAQNPFLLTEILRNRWGFPFYVVSDWNSIWNSLEAITAGCNICMGSHRYENDLLPLVQQGYITEDVIDDSVRAVLRTKILAGMLDYYPAGDPTMVNSVQHQELCLDAGRQSIVLLKNEEDILPLKQDRPFKMLLVGPSAAVAQLDGSGSSYVTPFYSVSPKQGITNRMGPQTLYYQKGCEINGNDTSGFYTAMDYASMSDLVIYVGGLDQTQEGEGDDRAGGSIELPYIQQELINKLASVNPNLIVVIKSGGICGLSHCIDKIKGLLYAFYPGQEGGNAIADVLFGNVNPGGKLPVTMPAGDFQLPPWNDDFTDDAGCGYRWFDDKGLTPQFAFGFGLSYTRFSYGKINIWPTQAFAGEHIDITIDVANKGSVPGDEVVQLYLADEKSQIYMPKKQLKGFKKITLNAGETKKVHFTITPEELYYFDEQTKQYEIDPGMFTVLVGGSSDNLPAEAQFEILPAVKQPDLVITNIRCMPPYPLVGEEVVFLAQVVNQGTAPSPSQIHRVAFSVNGLEVSWAENFIGSIPAGGSTLVCADTGILGTNIWLASQAGSFMIGAWVDDQDSIVETVEHNNQCSRSLNVFDIQP